MLQIQKKAKIKFDNKELEINPNELGNFLLASISEQVTLEKGVVMSDIMNVTFHLKNFINSYFLEEYEGLNSLVSSGVVIKPITKIIIYKEMVISPEGEVITVPRVKTECVGNPKSGYFEVEVEIDDKLYVVDEYDIINTNKSIYTHFTFLEFLGAIFEDFQDNITRSAGI